MLINKALSSTSKISRSQDIIIPNIPNGLNTCWNHEWRERGRNNNANMLCLNTEMRATHTIQIQNPWEKMGGSFEIVPTYLQLQSSVVQILHCAAQLFWSSAEKTCQRSHRELVRQPVTLDDELVVRAIVGSGRRCAGLPPSAPRPPARLSRLASTWA